MIMKDIIKKKEVGKYEIIYSGEGVNESGGRLYCRIYIPDALIQLEDEQFLTDGLSSNLRRIYKEIGRLQGLSFYENNLKRKNGQFYKQEIIAVLESKGVEVGLIEVFSNQMTKEISRRKCFYECIEECEDITLKTILLGKVRVKNQSFEFRNHQIWKETKMKEVSLYEYNPPAPKYISKLMEDLEHYVNENTGSEVIIQACLLCYQFLTIMPYEEDNEIWMSILLNLFFQEQGMETHYYIPFARYLLEQNGEWKRVMRQVREEGDYRVWVQFFVPVIEKAISRTNQMIMQLENICKDTLSSIDNERQKLLLQNILVFMEENPIFVISDIEKNFHTAYNTAAKSVVTLEKHGLIREISHKQRYRVYCYDRYIQEILK